MNRILIAGIVGGILVFAWGAVSHMVLHIGDQGLAHIPDEDDVISDLSDEIQEPGVYIFPGLDLAREHTEKEMSDWEAKYTAGPNGFLVYHPQGETPMTARHFIVELIKDIVGALVAAFLISRCASGFFTRVFCVTLLGFFAWLVINVSYWNWYRFPTDFTLAAGIDLVAGWFVAGVALAAIVRRRKK